MTKFANNYTAIVFVIGSLISISIGIWTMYNLQQFSKYESTFVFKQRYPILVQWICYLLILNMFIKIPLSYFMITKDVYTSHTAFIIMVIFEASLYSFTMHAAGWLNLIRFVCLFVHSNMYTSDMYILYYKLLSKPFFHPQILVDLLSIPI